MLFLHALSFVCFQLLIEVQKTFQSSTLIICLRMSSLALSSKPFLAKLQLGLHWSGLDEMRNVKSQSFGLSDK